MITKKHISQLKKVATKSRLLIIDKTILINNEAVTASNSDVFVRIYHNYEVSGSGVISLDIFASIFDNIKKIDFVDNICTVTTLDNSTINIESLPGNEFPKVDEINLDNNIFHFDGGKLQGFENFVGIDDLRPAMQGIYIGDEICATNAHILKYIPSGVSGLDGIIIPALLAKIVDNYTYLCKVDKQNIRFINGNEGVLIQAKLIQEKYPNYKAVIPQNNTQTIKFNKFDLLNVTKQLKPFVNKHTKQIKFHLMPGGGINISGGDIDFNRLLNIPVKTYENNIQTGFDIGFNLSYIETILKQTNSDLIEFKLDSANRAAIINDNTLLMPVMIRD